MLDATIRTYINQSVLCWLATVDNDGQPNVSPKETFAAFDDSTIVIANIASPQSAKNVTANPLVAVSFVDILLQKGAQLKGHAKLVKRDDSTFPQLAAPLEAITQGDYPFATLFRINIETVKLIDAPSYRLYPNVPDVERINGARETYKKLDVYPKT